MTSPLYTQVQPSRNPQSSAYPNMHHFNHNLTLNFPFLRTEYLYLSEGLQEYFPPKNIMLSYGP